MKKRISKIIISIILFIIAECINTNLMWLRVVVFIASYLIVGAGVIKEAIEKIIHKDFFDENFLMTLATIGAICIKQYPEAVAVMLFYQIGELFQDLAVDKSKKSITSLINIRPDFANFKDNDGNIIKKNPDEIKINDIIIVKPGEKVPLDGIVIEGNSTLDTSTLTGEPMPRDIKENENIYSGCINLTGKLSIKVTKEFKESTVNKIIELVQNATEKKTNTENFITKFSKIYTPIVVVMAVVIATVPPFILKVGIFNQFIYKALTFLVISCPCALVISVPLSFFSGIGGASKKGILIKGSNYFEILKNTKTVIFDKTGTITKGAFKVQEIIPKNISRDDLLKVAAYAENFSNHPIAKSIKNVYKERIDESKISDLKEIPGKGVTCKLSIDIELSDMEKSLIDIKSSNIEKIKLEEAEIVKFLKSNNKEIFIAIGNIALMQENRINIGNIHENKTGTTLFVAINGNYEGKIIIEDEIKEDSKKAIQELKKLGINDTVMLTGDKKEVGEYVANQLNIDVVYSELLPEEKLKKLEELLTRNFKDNSGNIAFVGDGINDAPSLARADIGIAMGGLGSDAAIESADVVIMNDEPSKVATAIKIADKTIKIAKENIWFAIGVKILVLILSVLGMTTMWEAVFADVGVTVIAVINSFRALK